MHHSVLSTGRLWVLFWLAALLSGCADAPWPSGVEGPIEKPPSPGSGVLAEFVAHVRPSRRTVTLARLPRENRNAPGASPESLTDLDVVQDGIPGSGPVNTVDLVTNTIGYDSECPAGFQSNAWCANVTLEQFFRRSLSNVFVQVTSVTDLAGAPLSGHGGINNDAGQLGLDASQGLWKYTTPSSTTPGVLGQSPNNTGSRDWVFANPDDADTIITFRVLASLTFSGYGLGPSPTPFVDACSGSGVLRNLGSPGGFTAVQTLPFPFVLYDQVFTTVRILKRGVVSFGTAGVNIAPVSVNLPSADVTVPRPGLFAFWDGIDFRPSGVICTRETNDPPPNRRYVVTWTDMDFGQNKPQDNPAQMRFSAVLSEGSNQVDLVYSTMTGKSTRANGSSATVGVQNATGTLGTASFQNTQFLSGKAFSLLPLP
jgi:hypothetical protein